jgi:hypothetical protein
MNKIWTGEDITFLIEDYPLQGASFCAKKLNRTVRAVQSKCSLLKIRPLKETITSNNRQAQLKYNESRPNTDFNVNVEQFLDIKTPGVAYFLGFLWADGYIVRQEIRLSILSVDMGAIKSTLNVLGKWNYNERVRSEGNPICTAFTNNKKLFEFLVKNDYKIKSGASADKILKRIPLHLKHYFFRGLIDGDGHINKNGIFISSCFQQNWKYVSDICIELGIKSYSYQSITDKSKSSKLEMNGINGLLFGDYIYQNIELDNIGLLRKFNSYLKLKNKVENGERYVSDKNKTLALEMYNSGFSIVDIIKDIGIPSTTLRRFIKSI